MSVFTEKAPIERGFAAVYAERISPRLDELEAERIRLQGKARRGVLVALAVAAVIGGIVLAIWENPIAAGIVGAIALGIGAMISFAAQGGAWTQRISDAVMPVVCDFLGDCSFDRTAKAGFDTGTLKTLRMLPNYDRIAISDRLEGTYRDTGYELVEAHLETETTDSENRTSRSTTFRGILFRIEVPIPVPTPIVILRDWGSVGNSLASLFTGGKGRGMPKVQIDHDGFEALFEVHASDAEAARAFLPPLFLDNLMQIAREEGGAKGTAGMRAAFSGDSFFLALDRRKGFLELGGLSRSVHEIEPELHAVFHDMELVRRVIDRLHGDAPGAAG